MRRTDALLAFGSEQTGKPGAMPLVFVHGVNVRKQSQSDQPGQPTVYEKVVARRDGFFGEIALKPIAADPARLVVRNPYWGDEAAKFPWGQGALPDDEYERFGREADLDPELVLSATVMGPLYALDDERPPEAILPWLARRSMAAAVDLLVMTANDPEAPLADTSELARLADGLGGYAEAFSNRSPDWLGNVQTDAQFVDRLITAIRDFRDDTPRTRGEWESFGVLGDAWQGLRDAADRIKRAATQTARSTFRTRLRAPLHDRVARFLGDVFIYLKRRDKEGANEPILKIVLADLDVAGKIKEDTNEPLILVGHSMGGNILYDCLTKFRTDLEVDLFLTVGSQLAVFEELKLFAISDDSVPKPGVPKVKKPDKVAHWLNVFDHSDVLGFAASKVFTDVEDFEFDAGKWLLSAHGGYFDQATFYHRFGKRLRQLELVK